MKSDFKCPSCGSNFTITGNGMSGTIVTLEELGGAGTSGASDVKKWPEAQTLKDKWGIIGLNNHEEASLKLDYNDIVPEYINLKLKILALRDAAKQQGEKIFYDALRIYIYSIYENLFYGYMISYATGQNSAFIFSDKDKIFHLYQQYYNHLPSFSSALLNFGNCRDLIFVLVRLAPKKSLNDANEYYKIIKVKNYRWNEFCIDLKILSNDTSYINDGKEIFELHQFRNIYEHKFRLLWWWNKKRGDNIYFIKKELYEAVLKGQDTVKTMLFNILEDPQKYEDEILNANPSEIISSVDILKNIHDKMAQFFNNTLKHISKML